MKFEYRSAFQKFITITNQKIKQQLQSGHLRDDKIPRRQIRNQRNSNQTRDVPAKGEGFPSASILHERMTSPSVPPDLMTGTIPTPPLVLKTNDVLLNSNLPGSARQMNLN